MRIRLERAKRVGSKIGLDEDKGFVFAVLLAVIIVSATVIGYYAWLKPQAEAYNTIALLDNQKIAVDYPEVLVANQNSTFNVYVNVTNHMGESASYQVQVKITKNLVNLPVETTPTQTFEINNLGNGKSWENLVSLTQNEVGSYSVVFELYKHKSDGSLEFTQDYNVLNIQVIN
jgi:uncharacterized membrane protein